MQLNKKKVLVTGGAGAIGSNLVKSLLEKDNLVFVIDDFSSGFRENIPDDPNLILIKGDINNDNMLDKVFSDNIYCVFHLAAHFANQNSIEHPFDDLNTNGMGTLKILERCRKYNVKKFIYSSSSCVYENSEKPFSESFSKKVETPYGITKLLGEQYTLFYHEYHKINSVVVRYFNSYGPGERPGRYRNVIPNFIFRAINNNPLIITGDGTETRDFTYVHDIVSGTILAAETEEVSGEVFNIGTGKETKIHELAMIINEIVGNEAGIEFVEKRDWDQIKNRIANISKARKLLNYKTEVSLNVGLQKTYDWFIQNKIVEH
ncbi:NAD-dependent epimerase/dehydratase family protein [candidate division KSB1 bacterium]|nr:NAD-dependent epimerase/dehydratase family protein [candidate division KSB1 bacterium]